jgi:hypothetical protein
MAQLLRVSTCNFCGSTAPIPPFHARVTLGTRFAFRAACQNRTQWWWWEADQRTPEFGVVDEKCRVFGARNVAIADSAVFTIGPEKNPVLTAMALAARAAECLARDLR